MVIVARIRCAGRPFLAVVMATALAVGVAAVPAAAAPGVQSLSTLGIALAPDEADADAVISAPPGVTVDATVTPAGCNADACRYRATAVSPASRGSARPTALAGRPAAPAVVALNGANVRVDIVSTVTPLAAAAAPLAAAATPTIWVTWVDGDKNCSTGGCSIWHIYLSSRAYFDGKYAWGTRSRYGYAGSLSCGEGGIGFSVDQQDCSFHGDPSISDLYAAHQAKVAFLVQGLPISNTHYIHRHYTGTGRSWAVFS